MHYEINPSTNKSETLIEYWKLRGREAVSLQNCCFQTDSDFPNSVFLSDWTNSVFLYDNKLKHEYALHQQ